MSIVTREQVGAALFALLQTAHAFPTSSRKLQEFDKTSVGLKPALYVIEHREMHKKGDLMTPAVRTIMYDVYIFANTGVDPNVIPITELNGYLDSIDGNSGGVLAPNPLTNKQTLGGLVYDCYIEGDIVKVPGDLDGEGILLIPVKVELP